MTRKRRSKNTPLQSPTDAEERPIDELMVVLGRDFDRLAKRMLASAKRGYVSSADAAHARNLVRCLFALVEGVTFAIKLWALGRHVDEGKRGPPGAGELVFEERYDIADKGEIVTRPVRITLERNVKFAFRFFVETYGIPNPLKTDSDWWRAFKRCGRVRNRLMHPRRPEDLDITPKEIIDAVTAEAGFRETVAGLLGHKGSRSAGTVA